jgi:hypothetical protein
LQIFELISNIGITDFGLANWQSTIRGELSVSTHFAGLANWLGRETADLVYTDSDGAFTQYLRDHCEGSFPHQIPVARNFVTRPIEYYLEVKTSTQAYDTRFYMSSGQYQRVSPVASSFDRSLTFGAAIKMEDMALPVFQQPDKVYVIMRVYDIMSPNVGLKIFVEPLRFKGTGLVFEAEKWFVRAQ